MKFHLDNIYEYCLKTNNIYEVNKFENIFCDICYIGTHKFLDDENVIIYGYEYNVLGDVRMWDLFKQFLIHSIVTYIIDNYEYYDYKISNIDNIKWQKHTLLYNINNHKIEIRLT
jgi:hypothetical protein